MEEKEKQFVDVEWDKVQIKKEDLKGDVRSERSFLLKALISFFMVIILMVMLVLMYQLVVDAKNTDKTIEVLKLVFSMVSPILGVIIGFYFGKNHSR